MRLWKRKTGLLDKNGFVIYEGSIIFAGMRRGDRAGWTRERVVMGSTGEWVLADPKTGEKMDMQWDRQLRALIRE